MGRLWMWCRDRGENEKGRREDRKGEGRCDDGTEPHGQEKLK